MEFAKVSEMQEGSPLRRELDQSCSGTAAGLSLETEMCQAHALPLCAKATPCLVGSMTTSSLSGMRQAVSGVNLKFLKITAFFQ